LSAFCRGPWSSGLPITSRPIFMRILVMKIHHGFLCGAVDRGRGAWRPAAWLIRRALQAGLGLVPPISAFRKLGAPTTSPRRGDRVDHQPRRPAAPSATSVSAIIERLLAGVGLRESGGPSIIDPEPVRAIEIRIERVLASMKRRCRPSSFWASRGRQREVVLPPRIRPVDLDHRGPAAAGRPTAERRYRPSEPVGRYRRPSDGLLFLPEPHDPSPLPEGPRLDRESACGERLFVLCHNVGAFDDSVNVAGWAYATLLIAMIRRADNAGMRPAPYQENSMLH